jgi:hypothetical protein
MSWNDRFYYSALLGNKSGQDFTAAILPWPGNVGSDGHRIYYVIVWSEDWRKKEIELPGAIAKVGMSEVSGLVYRGIGMRTDIGDTRTNVQKRVLYQFNNGLQRESYYSSGIGTPGYLRI